MQLLERNDPALALVAMLRDGRGEAGGPLTYGEAALYAGHVVDALDDYFNWRQWSSEEFAARQRPKRSTVSMSIDDARRESESERD